MTMAYDSFWNQLYHIAHYSMAFLILFWLWPRLAFADSSGDRLERYINLYVKTSFFYIIIGYLLVLSRFYEVIAISFVVIAILILPFLRSNKAEVRKKALSGIRFRFYDALEAGFLIKHRIAIWRGKNKLTVKRFRTKLDSEAVIKASATGNRLFKYIIRKIDKYASFLLLIFVLAGAAYIRFYDVIKEAATPLSDSYVALAWMKYIERRILFNDGFYPAGLHITLAYLHKFAAIDQLYVLKYTGPLLMLLIVLSFYFVISRLTGNRYVGIITASLYGWMGHVFLMGEWDRQVGTNSQEFAFVFVLPAIYFCIKYLMTGKLNLLTAMLAATSVAGFAHMIAYGYLAIGIICVVAVAVCIDYRRYFRRSLWVALAGLTTAVLSYSQLLLAQLLKAKQNDSVQGFINSKVNVPPSPFHLWDFVAISGLVAALLGVLFIRKSLSDKLPEISILLFGVASALLYRYGGTLSHSEMIYARANDLWGIGGPLSIGIGLAALWKIFQRIPKKKIWEPLLCFVVLISIIYTYPLHPIIGYKMEWESSVRQYIRISSQYLPKTWTIFSQDEGFDLALGNGFHTFLAQFNSIYDPNSPNPFPTRIGETKEDKDIAPDAFVFHEKHVYRVSKTNSIYSVMLSKYEQREKDNADFEKWLITYEKIHPRPEVFYEDENLVVYHFRLSTNPLTTPDAVFNGPVPLNRLQN
jgi:hypothetical protein